MENRFGNWVKRGTFIRLDICHYRCDQTEPNSLFTSKRVVLQETALVIESILAEFQGPASLDIDGIYLFKSPEAVDANWAVASKHLSCIKVG